MMLRSAVNYNPKTESWSLSTRDCIKKSGSNTSSPASSSGSSPRVPLSPAKSPLTPSTSYAQSPLAQNRGIMSPPSSAGVSVHSHDRNRVVHCPSGVLSPQPGPSGVHGIPSRGDQSPSVFPSGASSSSPFIPHPSGASPSSSSSSTTNSNAYPSAASSNFSHSGEPSLAFHNRASSTSRSHHGVHHPSHIHPDSASSIQHPGMASPTAHSSFPAQSSSSSSSSSLSHAGSSSSTSTFNYSTYLTNMASNNEIEKPSTRLSFHPGFGSASPPHQSGFIKGRIMTFHLCNIEPGDMGGILILRKMRKKEKV